MVKHTQTTHLNVFDHFVKLTLEGLTLEQRTDFRDVEADYCSQMFFRIGVLKNFANFTGK